MSMSRFLGALSTRKVRHAVVGCGATRALVPALSADWVHAILWPYSARATAVRAIHLRTSLPAAVACPDRYSVLTDGKRKCSHVRSCERRTWVRAVRSEEPWRINCCGAAPLGPSLMPHLALRRRGGPTGVVGRANRARLVQGVCSAGPWACCEVMDHRRSAGDTATTAPATERYGMVRQCRYRAGRSQLMPGSSEHWRSGHECISLECLCPCLGSLAGPGDKPHHASFAWATVVA
jgi:hypothetical protein